MTRIQIKRSWDKAYLKNSYITFESVYSAAMNEGYDNARNDLLVKIKELEDRNKQLVSMNSRVESAIKLANAMGQAQDCLAHSVRYLVLNKD